jgi:hypothetical protein
MPLERAVSFPFEELPHEINRSERKIIETDIMTPVYSNIGGLFIK